MGASETLTVAPKVQAAEAEANETADAQALSEAQSATKVKAAAEAQPLVDAAEEKSMSEAPAAVASAHVAQLAEDAGAAATEAVAAAAAAVTEVPKIGIDIEDPALSLRERLALRRGSARDAESIRRISHTRSVGSTHDLKIAEATAVEFDSGGNCVTFTVAEGVQEIEPTDEQVF
jgi:cytoskeletal protein RodZ